MITHADYKAAIAEKKVTESQKNKMLHAIGWNERSDRIYTRAGTRYFRPYRNYYDAGEPDQKDWQELTEKGLAKQYGSGIFYVTNAGLDLLSAIMRTYIYCDNSDCVADAKGEVVDILIADACYCGYGCWLPTSAKDIARRARLPLALTRKTLRSLCAEGITVKSYYGECDDEGFQRCYHGYYFTTHGKEIYKERYEKAWKAECEYIDKITRRGAEDE